MIRFLLRILGFVLLAAAFVGAVLDGARSIANNALLFTTLADLALALFKERYLALQPALERIHPVLWKAVMPLVQAPAVAVALVLGALLLWAGQRPREPIGYLARR